MVVVPDLFIHTHAGACLGHHTQSGPQWPPRGSHAAVSGKLWGVARKKSMERLTALIHSTESRCPEMAGPGAHCSRGVQVVAAGSCHTIRCQE